MFHYPNGQPTRQTKQTTNYASRGMSLEEKLNQTNDYYMAHRIAVIHKKPTPIQVVKVDYPKRSAAKIVEAYYRHASTTDYNGIYQARYIDFEAKETTNKTRFPLTNLLAHQWEHMSQCHEQGGIVFLIVSFKVHQTIFLLPYEKLIPFIQNKDSKSIPYTYFLEEAIECPTGLFPYIDYLKAVDILLEQ